MKKLNTNTLFQVSGGFGPLFGAAAPTVTRSIVMGIGAFNGGAATVLLTANHIQGLNNLGASIGEAAFNVMNPNPLGQTVYNK